MHCLRKSHNNIFHHIGKHPNLVGCNTPVLPLKTKIINTLTFVDKYGLFRGLRDSFYDEIRIIYKNVVINEVVLGNISQSCKLKLLESLPSNIKIIDIGKLPETDIPNRKPRPLPSDFCKYLVKFKHLQQLHCETQSPYIFILNDIDILNNKTTACMIYLKRKYHTKRRSNPMIRDMYHKTIPSICTAILQKWGKQYTFKTTIIYEIGPYSKYAITMIFIQDDDYIERVEYLTSIDNYKINNMLIPKFVLLLS